MCNMQEFGIQIELTMTGHNRTTTSRRKELCTWNCVCVVKLNGKTSDTNDNVKTKIQSNINTKHRKPNNDVTHLGEHVNVRVVVTVLSVLVLFGSSHSFLAHIAWLEMSACLSHLIHAWSERFVWLSCSLHRPHLPSLIPHQPQAVRATLQLPRGHVVRSPVLLRQGDGVNWRVTLQHRLWAQGLLPHGDLRRVPNRVQHPATVSQQRFLEDVDYDDAAIGEMLCHAYREQVYHSQREDLSVGQSSSSMSDRLGQPVVERGQELNTEHAQIRTLLDRRREQILADCKAEIKRHEFQANYDRRSTQKLSETIESQQEELHRAQAEELHRRDQQLLHAQLLKKNYKLREAHDKSLKEMEELKKCQSSTFDTIARRRLVEDSRYYSGTYW